MAYNCSLSDLQGWFPAVGTGLDHALLSTEGSALAVQSLPTALALLVWGFVEAFPASAVRRRFRAVLLTLAVACAFAHAVLGWWVADLLLCDGVLDASSVTTWRILIVTSAFVFGVVGVGVVPRLSVRASILLFLSAAAGSVALSSWLQTSFATQAAIAMVAVQQLFATQAACMLSALPPSAPRRWTRYRARPAVSLSRVPSGRAVRFRGAPSSSSTHRSFLASREVEVVDALSRRASSTSHCLPATRRPPPAV